MVLRLLSPSRPGEHQSGTSETFDQARAGFEVAWGVIPLEPDRGRFSGLAPRGSSAASIAASACRRIGNGRCSAPVAELGWKRRFDEPIPLPRGRQLVALLDAGRYIQKRPEAEPQLEEWGNAVEALILVAELDGPP